jgi:hypothetical protein
LRLGGENYFIKDPFRVTIQATFLGVVVDFVGASNVPNMKWKIRHENNGK